MRFSTLVQYFEAIEKTSSRLEMTSIFAELLKAAPHELADKVVYLSQGSIAPPFEGVDLGVGEKFVMEAISTVSGFSRENVEKAYKKEGDLGLVAFSILKNRRQQSLFSQELTVERVFSSFEKIASQSGRGSQESKIKLLAELLNSATPVEGKYIVRFPTGKLRLGIGDPTMLDALSFVEASDKSMRAEIERAYNLCSDLGLVAKGFLLDKDSIKKFKATPLKPIRPALAERENSAEAIFERLGECSVEAKYDGLRMQVHKSGGKVEIFSRKLEKMTPMFPDIVAAAKALPHEKLIFEGEALAYSPTDGKYLSFQQLMQRKRKHGIGKKSEEMPLQLFVFDIMLAGGKDYTLEPYSVRRKKIEEIFRKKDEILLPSARIIAKSAKELEVHFQKSIKEGLEGIIAKDLSAPYVAGARKFAWIKLKKSYGALADTVDVVIVGYYLGKGQRQEFEFGGLLAAVRNDENGEFETVARIGSGFSEDEMGTLQQMLEKIKADGKPSRVNSKIEPDFWVEPKYVITVAADEVSLSPLHTCGMSDGKGYALRFPRMIAFREDKGPMDATTTGEIITLYGLQHPRHP